MNILPAAELLLHQGFELPGVEEMFAGLCLRLGSFVPVERLPGSVRMMDTDIVAKVLGGHPAIADADDAIVVEEHDVGEEGRMY